MNKLKKQLIYYLGGIVVNDLPIEIQKSILEYCVGNLLNNYLINRLTSGFKTTYIKDEKQESKTQTKA